MRCIRQGNLSLKNIKEKAPCYGRVAVMVGAVVALALVLYPITRATIELLRGDELGQFGTSLTIAQWVSLGIFAGGLVLWVGITRAGRQLGTPPPAPSP